MIHDVCTVLWKECRELLSFRGGIKRGGLTIIIFLVVFGILLPLDTGRGWIEQPTILLMWAWVPMFLVNGVVADSFAGERERHTLETLLSTRLPEHAILLGKVLAAIFYGWIQSVIALFAGAIAVTIAYGEGQVLFYPPAIALGALLLSLLSGGLAAGVGVLISLRAATVRQAQQTLSVAILILFLAATYGTRALPASAQSQIMTLFIGIGETRLIVAVAAILLLLDAIFLAAARARFVRSRLILD